MFLLNKNNKHLIIGAVIWVTLVLLCFGIAFGQGKTCKNVYPVKRLTPKASQTPLKIGDKAPDFSLPSVGGGVISLNQYLNKKNVVISFVPAAWTPVCSAQWPVYDMEKEMFNINDTVVLGISVDNAPSLYAWMKEISLDQDKFWFPVLSDFFPHGQVAMQYGVLRPEGFTERALFVIDKEGIIRSIDVHDINEIPPIDDLQRILEGITQP